MRKGSLKTIADALHDKELQPIERIVTEGEAVTKFAEIFPDFKKIAKAKKINNKTLFLRVENSVWRSELNLHKATIIKKINDYFGKEIVKNIRFI